LVHKWRKHPESGRAKPLGGCGEAEGPTAVVGFLGGGDNELVPAREIGMSLAAEHGKSCVCQWGLRHGKRPVGGFLGEGAGNPLPTS